MRKLVKRLNQMTDFTYLFLRHALMLAAVLAGAALALFLWSGGPTELGYNAYHSAWELLSHGSLTLLLATIGSVFVEEFTQTTQNDK